MVEQNFELDERPFKSSRCCIEPIVWPHFDEGPLNQNNKSRNPLKGLGVFKRFTTWIWGSRPAQNNQRALRSVFLRWLVATWIIDPHRFNYASQASVARRYQFHRQPFNAAVTSFHRHFHCSDVRFRSPLRLYNMRVAPGKESIQAYLTPRLVLIPPENSRDM